MMDEEDSQVPIWSYRVNLDKRVRDDHPLRRIRAALDLSFVRKEVAHTCGRRGNKSVQPEVIVRMMLLLFLDEEQFTYDAWNNTYRCPAGQLMKPRRLHLQRLTWEYVTAKGTL